MAGKAGCMIRCPEVDDQWSLSVSSDLVLVPIQFQFARNLFHLIDQSRLTLGQWLPWVVHVNQCEDLHKLIRYYRNKNKESGAFTCCILRGCLEYSASSLIVWSSSSVGATNIL